MLSLVVQTLLSAVDLREHARSGQALSPAKVPEHAADAHANISVAELAETFLWQNDEANWEQFADVLRKDSTLRPRVLVSKGCSGSTPAITYLRMLIEAHGVKPAENKFELFRCDEGTANCATDVGSLRAAVARFAAKGQALVFKASRREEGFGTTPDVWQALRDMDARVAVAWRSNSLAQAACAVRDCFGEMKGKAKLVGNNTDSCFARRELEAEQQPRVWFYTSSLMQTLSSYQQDPEERAHPLLTAGWKRKEFSTQTTEDLLAFEDLSESGLAKSTKAWSDLLRSLGIEPRLEILTPILKTNTDATDPHEEKLEDVIANKDEVAALLNEAGAPFNDMLDASTGRFERRGDVV